MLLYLTVVHLLYRSSPSYWFGGFGNKCSRKTWRNLKGSTQQNLGKKTNLHLLQSMAMISPAEGSSQCQYATDWPFSKVNAQEHLALQHFEGSKFNWGHHNMYEPSRRGWNVLNTDRTSQWVKIASDTIREKKKAAKLWSSLSKTVTGTLIQPYLVAEDFNLAVGSVDRFVTPVIVAVSVDLKIQGQAFHSLLRGKICAEAVDRNENLQRRKAAAVSSDTRTPDWPLSKGSTWGVLRLKCCSLPLQQHLLSSETPGKIPKKQYNILKSLHKPLEGTKPLCPKQISTYPPNSRKTPPIFPPKNSQMSPSNF